MNKLEFQGLPTFFNYAEEGTDNGYETMQDFNLSWILRCADERFKNTNPKLYEYARHTVFALIYGDNIGGKYIVDKQMSVDFRISKVRTRRQYYCIDLIAEIDIEENSVQKKYVLNIENKWYTPIRNGQLECANKYLESEYNNKGFVIVNLVIFCDHWFHHPKKNEKQKCLDNRYKFLAISDIQELTKMKDGGETGNALFDAFWFRS